MFTNTYRYFISALVIYPLCAIITLAVLWGCFGQPWLALVWILLWFPLARFGLYYYGQCKRVAQIWRYNRLKDKIQNIEMLRKKIKDLL